MSEKEGAVEDLPCLIAQAAARQPSAPAIIASAGQGVATPCPPDLKLSYRDYDASVTATAERLRAVRVKSGDVFGIVSPARAEYAVLLMALFRLGAAACPISPRWPPQSIEDAVRRAQCRWVVGLDAAPSESASVLRFEDVVKMDAGQASHKHAPRIQAGVPATIIFTSGSTGTPKAAVQSYANHYFSAAASNSNLPVGPGDRWLLSLSLHHVAGLGVFFRCAAGGAAVVIPPPEESIEDAIERTNVTHVSLVPAQLYRLLDREQGREALKKLKAILVGGGAIPEAMIREADRLCLPIFTTYGLTEMASQVATTRKGDPLDRLLTSGKPLLPDTLRIDTDGEILVCGDALFLGYLGAEGLERPLTPDGWFRTGDLGKTDCQGYLSVIGRKDNMFVCGGENVHPEEIEQYLHRIPGLRSAVVVPVPDAKLGAIPVCFMMMEQGFQTDAAALARALAEALPRHKIPRRFFPWPTEFEPDDTKLNRSILSALARQLLAASTF